MTSLCITEGELLGGSASVSCPHCMSLIALTFTHFEPAPHTTLDLARKLTKNQGRVFDILYAYQEQVVDLETVTKAVWGTNAVGDWYNWRHTVRVQVSRLRKALVKTGWDIETITSRGYRLTHIV